MNNKIRGAGEDCHSNKNGFQRSGRRFSVEGMRQTKSGSFTRPSAMLNAQEFSGQTTAYRYEFKRERERTSKVELSLA